jgi:hypothetical protein
MEEQKQTTELTNVTKNIFNILAKDEQLVSSLPAELNQKLVGVTDIISQNKTLPQLYGDILTEIPVSQSLFQDVCVQYEIHFTPHRKLRQAMLELDGRLRALYAAKDGHAEAYYKVEQTKLKLEELENELASVTDDFERRRLELRIGKLRYELEKKQRDLENAIHLVKDAMLKVAMHQTLVDRLKKEVEESGLSFEEAEMVYFVMYFTKDAEVQLRTMGRVDTGTFGAIAQLPEGIRKKVLWNIEFMRKKLQEENYNGDYLHIIYRDILLPKKTGENEIEGCNVKEFTGLEPIKVLAKSDESGR